MVEYQIIEFWQQPYIVAKYKEKIAYFGLPDQGFESLKKDFPNENLVEVTTGFESFIQELDAYASNRLTEFKTPLYMSGTKFQQNVYIELGKVPFGTTVSYQDLANRIGNTKGVRAVANAVGRNRHLIMMPCHRVIAKDGSLGGFSSGIELKKKLLAHESVVVKGL